MENAVKITSFEIENVKRVRAVTMKPDENGLTIIGGGNGQGKTSVLDAIAWGLGGDRFKPTSPTREGSVIPPHIFLTLSNGLQVERKGENSSLTVMDPTGKRAGQQLLNSFVEQLALDLPKFMQSSNKEKANTLLKIIGVGPQLMELDDKIARLYSERTYVGREQLSKQKHADEMPEYLNAPAEPVSAVQLIQQQQEILLRNAKNQELRNKAEQLKARHELKTRELDILKAKLMDAKAAFEQAMENLDRLTDDLETASESAKDLQDESTEELEASIRDIDEINAKVRANMERQRALDAAEDMKTKYDDMTRELESLRDSRMALLKGAGLPLDGLMVEDGEITYHGVKWDCMSGAEQLKVSTAIVRAVNPKCGFVLMDKLEQMDRTTLKEFGQWLSEQGLQVIATRVSTGDECSIVIEDGYAISGTEPAKPENKWKGVALD